MKVRRMDCFDTEEASYSVVEIAKNNLRVICVESCVAPSTKNYYGWEVEAVIRHLESVLGTEIYYAGNL